MFQQTKDNTIYIGAKQYLKDIVKSIPSNVIVFKKLPGLGATSGEIENKTRNSIIIEPNVPVIVGKCKKYNGGKAIKLLGVYEGKTEEQILDYLNSKVKVKKIIVTPESFRRVKDAINSVDGYNLYSDFFLLFDECERTIQDVSYRADIVLPINDFFKFKNKAFISATPIMPSDPRFKKEKFRTLFIEPNFKYKETLKLVSTNNVFLSFKQFLKKNPREKYFIFFKSTDSIGQFIRAFDIQQESAVFCAKESKQKLKANGFSFVHTSLEPFKKYNFFTGRFFSAVDIEYEDYKCNPTIIMLTDLVFAPHSIIDPLTESIQIAGRFRRPKDENITLKKEIVHITNYDPVLQSMTRKEAIQYVNERFLIYEYLNVYLTAATKQGTIDALKEMLDRSEYKRYINPDGSRNYFMQDNIIHQYQTNAFYHNSKNLKAAYQGTSFFNIDDRIDEFKFSDKDRKASGQHAPLKSVFEIVVPILHEINKPGYNIFKRINQMDFLEAEYPKAVSAYRLLGYERIKELNFNYSKVKTAIKQKEDIESAFGLVDFIDKNFKVGEELSSSQICGRIANGIKQNKLYNLKPNVHLLQKYCKLSNRFSLGRKHGGKEVKGYRILEIYHNVKQ
ncbi:hypothetical protein MUY27_13915 [Mucilaginibacter sp. RS28]|uniref:Uncharacterized protein n=1 Tax=Mucilaginibacter straminoryzae TaxID=2932774 RepID=A0A9X2B9M8_9SPHI|nr:hypothetical protein [Mucilaginibacter straminoryzae]MCJ8210809.1 hypothetical protein [Mucilaginibacter straminoryzae]